MSLVAALIIGDAAIGAGLLSTPVILVASITAISVFVTPSLYEPATLLRLGVTLAAGLAGPVGLVCAALGVLAALTSISAMGVPYLSGAVFSGDGVVRRNYRALSRRPFTINAAEHIGVADRVGSLETGKDADLVICKGSPMEISGVVKYVFINGELVE